MPGLVAAKKTKGIAETRGGQAEVSPGMGAGGVDGDGDGHGLRVPSGDGGDILLTGTCFPALLLFILHPREGSERGGVPTFG